MKSFFVIKKRFLSRYLTDVGVVVALLSIVFGVCLQGCSFLKPKGSRNTGPAQQNSSFNLQTAQRSSDTLGIRTFLAGNWTLHKICHSGFAGLKCDTSIKQSWHLDSLGGIKWVTEGEDSGQDHYHFVPGTGHQAGTSGRDTSWVLFLNEGHRRYLIRSLTKDSLALSEFPLMMDNSTTYFLSR